jgi:HK97 gp10 family phage protein
MSVRKEVVNEIEMTLAESGEDIEARAKQLAPVDQGKLRNATISDASNPLRVEIYNNNFYAPFVEFGTKRKFDANGREKIASEFKGQGKGRPFQELVENIYDWLKRTSGFPPDVRGQAAKLNYAKFVALRIAKNGIRPQPFFYKAYDEVLPDIKRKLKEILK